MDYSGLPNEIIEKIASHHLDTVSQLISFAGVCRSWRSAAVLLRFPPQLLVPATAAADAILSPDGASTGQIHDLVSLTALTALPPPPPPPPPSIALPLFPPASNMSDAHGQRDRYLRLHQQFLTSFPVIRQGGHGDDDDESTSDHDAHCLASKDGWILRSLPARGDGYVRSQIDLHLINPLTGASIPLPPITKPEYADDVKAIISSSPEEEEDRCYVFTLSTWQNNLLAWCKVGPGGGWTFPPKNCLVRLQDDTPIRDASYSGGNLYLVGEESLWVVHDILKPFSAATGPTVRAFPFSRYMNSLDAQSCCRYRSLPHPYLCHLSGRGGRGEVRVVIPDYNGRYYGDYLAFHVFRLVVDEECDAGIDEAARFRSGKKVERGVFWEEVWSLDGHAVFIGAHQSICLPTGSGSGSGSVINPNGNGIRGDHIYFALNRVCCHRETFGEANWDGVFDVAGQEFQRFADERYRENKTMHATFWFIPVPWGSTRGRRGRKKKGKKKKKKKQIEGAASQETETST